MNYNVYQEHDHGANNHLDLSHSDVHSLLDTLNTSGFLKKEGKIYYGSGNSIFALSIFTNNYQKGELNLWDYCVEKGFYDYCPSPAIGGDIVITPRFLKLFGKECTYDFVKDKLAPF
jgi:hypothetical protein